MNTTPPLCNRCHQPEPPNLDGDRLLWVMEGDCRLCSDCALGKEGTEEDA